MFKSLVVSIFMLLGMTMTLSALNPGLVSAASAANCSSESTGFLGFPTWYKFLEPAFANGECVMQFLERDDNGLINALPRILLAVFEIILRVAGLAAVGFVIFGGIQYILSQGEPEHTKAAKNTIVNALVGLIVAMFATAIVNLIGTSIT